jgi:hypothetical protein
MFGNTSPTERYEDAGTPGPPGLINSKSLECLPVDLSREKPRVTLSLFKAAVEFPGLYVMGTSTEPHSRPGGKVEGHADHLMVADALN